MFTIRLLGGILVQGPSGPLSGRAAQRHPLALLAMLAGSAENGVSREKLAAYLWPESHDARARRNLSDTVYVLRKALREDVVLAVGDTLRLNAHAVRVDVWALESALERDDLAEAADLYGGDFLDGFHLGDAREFEEWVSGQRARLADLYAGALESLAEKAEQRDEHRAAAERWKQLAAHDRYNSRAVLRLMQALIAAGDPANALGIGRAHEQLLREELDLRPPAELMDCIETLRKPSAAGAEPRGSPAGDERTRAPVPAATTVAKVSTSSTGEAVEPGPGGDSGRRRLAIGVTLAVALASGVYWGVSQAGSGAGQDAEPTALNRIAVFPFAYQGSEEYATFGDGVTYLLSAALDGAGGWTVVDPHALLPAVNADSGDAPDVDRADRIASVFGAGRFVLGQVVETHAQLRLSGWLYEAGAPVTHASVDGAIEDFTTLVDRLAARLAVSLLGEGGASLAGSAARSTDSFEALKAYLQGEAAFRSGKTALAMDAFERAVELDSTFALAWYRLALASDWMWQRGLGSHAADQAVRHAGRLGFREQSILRGWRAQQSAAFEEAERQYAAVLARYPDDVEAWYGLGALRYHYGYLHGQPFMSAREPLERASTLSLGDRRAVALLMYEAALSDDWERYDSLLHVIAPDGNVAPVLRLGLPSVRGSQREWDATREAVLASVGPESDSDLQSDIVIAAGLGELHLARQLAGLLAHRASPDAQALGRLSLAFVALAGGRWKAAQAELDTLATLQPAWGVEYRALMATAPFLSASRADLEVLKDRLSRWDAAAALPNPHPSPYINAYNGVHMHLRLYLLGLVSARLGDDTAAHALAEELDGLAALDAGSLSTDLAQSIRARVAWSRGAYDEVLEELGRAPMAIPYELTFASPFFSRAAERYLRARALQEMGRLREAAIVYETHGKFWPDLVFRAPSELGLAEISEALGDTVRARRHYDEVLRLWRDSDPELRPVVELARGRLAALSGER